MPVQLSNADYAALVGERDALAVQVADARRATADAGQRHHQPAPTVPTKKFIVDGHAYTEEEMLAANAEAPDVCEWVKGAKAGDRCPAAMLECVCVADEAVFWAAADEQIKLYGGQLLGRMIADGARDTGDAEIERTLAGCVCGPMLVVLAKEMRRRGLLVLDRAVTLRDFLPPHWVVLIAKHDACVVTTPGGPCLLDWDAGEPCSIDIITTTQDADAMCARWEEHADLVREIACQRIGMLAWG